MNPFDAPHPATQANATGQVCDRCGSRVAGLCQPLDAAALDEISSEAQQMVLPAHSAVFREGDPAGRVFTLIDGFAKLSRLLPDGKQQVVGFRFAGDVIGYTTLKNYPFDAELLTDAKHLPARPRASSTACCAATRSSSGGCSTSACRS